MIEGAIGYLTTKRGGGLEWERPLKTRAKGIGRRQIFQINWRPSQSFKTLIV